MNPDAVDRKHKDIMDRARGGRVWTGTGIASTQPLPPATPSFDGKKGKRPNTHKQPPGLRK